MSSMENGAATAPKGGFWVRFVALLIDSVILYIPLVIVGALLGAFSRNANGGLSAAAPIWYFLALIVPIVYFVYFWSASGGGQTMGMRALKLRVIKTDGSSLSLGSSVLRYLGTIVNSIIFGLPIGWVWAAFDRNKQGWHDKIASSYVVKV